MILVVGSINMDVNIRVKALPKPGETVLAKGITQSPGGKGANQAVAAAKSGGDVVMLGCVGADEVGEEMLRAMETYGVDTKYIHCAEKVPTSKAYIHISEDSENNIVVDSSANWLVSPQYLEAFEELFQEAEYCILQLEIPAESVLVAEKLCEKYGTKIIFNPSPIDSCKPEMLQHVHTLIVNQTEGERLSGLSAEQITEENWMEFMEKYDISNVVQTLGSKGSMFYQQGEPAQFYPAYKCKANDTTGAGDTFLGALVAMFAEQKSTEEAFRYAAVASGLEVMQPGTQNAMPNRQEVMAVLEG